FKSWLTAFDGCIRFNRNFTFTRCYATCEGMPTKRTGHTGSPRPEGGYPNERLARAIFKAIRDEAKATGTTLQEVIARRVPDALELVKRPPARPKGSNPPAPRR